MINLSKVDGTDISDETANEWNIHTIGHLLKFFDHKRVPLNGRQRSGKQGIYPYYGASGIVDYLDDYIFDGCYLLIAEDGENLNSRKTPIAFFARGKFWVNNHAHVVKAIDGVCDLYYIKAWFDQANVSGYITGAAQPKLSQGNLKRVELCMPSLGTQRKIAAILSAYDDLIENNTRRIKILEEMAQSIYKEWFVNFRFPGHEKTGLMDSPIGPIPKGWQLVSLFDVAEVTYGYPFKSSLFSTEPIGFPVVRIRNIPKLASDIYTPENPDSKYLIGDGDILIGMDGDFHMAIWPSGPALQNQRIARLRPKANVLRQLLYLAVQPHILRFNATITGTTVAHLGDKHLKEIRLALPDDPTVEMANAILEPMMQLAVNLRKATTTLRQTRDLLLPKLISGEVDVSELDIKLPEEETA